MSTLFLVVELGKASTVLILLEIEEMYLGPLFSLNSEAEEEMP